MDRSEIEKLIDIASGDDKSALEVLYQAWDEKFNLYKSENTKSNLTEWQAAEKALKSKFDELSTKYVGNAETRILGNVIEAWRFLQTEGYKVGRQSVYNARDNGKLVVNPDGTVSEADALAYAAKFLTKIKNKKDDKSDKFFEEKANEDLALSKIKRKKAEFEYKQLLGQYILKSDARMEIAIKIATLEAGLKHLFRTFLADWIHRAGGSPKKTPMILQIVNKEIDSLMNEFGRMTDLGIIIVKGGETVNHHSEDLDGGVFDVDSSEVETVDT